MRRSLGQNGFRCPHTYSEDAGEEAAPGHFDKGPWTKEYVESVIAVHHAPILYHHPLEKYFLSDPMQWALRATLYDRFLRPQEQQLGHTTDGNRTQSGLNTVQPPPSMSSTQLQYSFMSHLNTSWLEWAMRGSDFDENGESQAKVWYNVLPHKSSGGWILNYNFFYGWNGCLNMVLGTAFKIRWAAWTGKGKSSTEQSLEYYFCPTGVHEGDWEHMSLLVCPDYHLSSEETEGLGQVHAALFSQHDYDALYNCTAKECEFEELVGPTLVSRRGRTTGRMAKTGEDAHNADANILSQPIDILSNLSIPLGDDSMMRRQHIVAYSAMHSHAMYPTQEPSTRVCGQVHTFHGEHDGIYVVDRVGSFPFKDDNARGVQGSGARNGTDLAPRRSGRWIPNANNLVLMPDPEGSTAASNVDPGSLFWYSGWWGARQADSPQPPALVCLFDDHQREGRCPNSPPAAFLRKLLSSPGDGSIWEPAGDTPVSGKDEGLGGVMEAAQNSHVATTVQLPPPFLRDFGQASESDWVGENFGVGRGPLYRVWSRIWEDPQDPPTWRVTDNIAFRLLNHWDTAAKQDCPLRMTTSDATMGNSLFEIQATWPLHVLLAVSVLFITAPLLMTLFQAVTAAPSDSPLHGISDMVQQSQATTGSCTVTSNRAESVSKAASRQRWTAGHGVVSNPPTHHTHYARGQDKARVTAECTRYSGGSISAATALEMSSSSASSMVGFIPSSVGRISALRMKQDTLHPGASQSNREAILPTSHHHQGTRLSPLAHNVWTSFQSFASRTSVILMHYYQKAAWTFLPIICWCAVSITSMLMYASGVVSTCQTLDDILGLPAVLRLAQVVLLTPAALLCLLDLLSTAHHVSCRWDSTVLPSNHSSAGARKQRQQEKVLCQIRSNDEAVAGALPAYLNDADDYDDGRVTSAMMMADEGTAAERVLVTNRPATQVRAGKPHKQGDDIIIASAAMSYNVSPDMTDEQGEKGDDGGEHSFRLANTEARRSRQSRSPTAGGSDQVKTGGHEAESSYSATTMLPPNSSGSSMPDATAMLPLNNSGSSMPDATKETRTSGSISSHQLGKDISYNYMKNISSTLMSYISMKTWWQAKSPRMRRGGSYTMLPRHDDSHPQENQPQQDHNEVETQHGPFLINNEPHSAEHGAHCCQSFSCKPSSSFVSSTLRTASKLQEMWCWYLLVPMLLAGIILLLSKAIILEACIALEGVAGRLSTSSGSSSAGVAAPEMGTTAHTQQGISSIPTGTMSLLSTDSQQMLARHRFYVQVVEVAAAMLAMITCLTVQAAAPCEWMVIGACVRACCQVSAIASNVQE
ncbi:hypothetical protein CEUSTIGMA_g9625.t1 [Chlamydomonas eustigma]|uniref:Transmembrane protein n=1 Tax=Chlamydomonas eustigma TaxID=1157962 RepID=A0A250XGK2_9CHLO|nr:hypothetical protein CEUSTIGMA_g9625.t1 [Chlamydomonas eustigma]|eukprot:GAX82197.1 hypothetical protein CEUSTIGMA_g9625.t1 [Chlamydomonas eustigma]